MLKQQCEHVNGVQHNCINLGRYLIRIIRPRLSGNYCSTISTFYGERVNIHGLTMHKRYVFPHTVNNPNELAGTHEEIDAVLTMLGVKKFKSKVKKEKITLLLKAV